MSEVITVEIVEPAPFTAKVEPILPVPLQSRAELTEFITAFLNNWKSEQGLNPTVPAPATEEKPVTLSAETLEKIRQVETLLAQANQEGAEAAALWANIQTELRAFAETVRTSRTGIQQQGAQAESALNTLLGNLAKQLELQATTATQAIAQEAERHKTALAEEANRQTTALAQEANNQKAEIAETAKAQTTSLTQEAERQTTAFTQAVAEQKTAFANTAEQQMTTFTQSVAESKTALEKIATNIQAQAQAAEQVTAQGKQEIQSLTNTAKEEIQTAKQKAIEAIGAAKPAGGQAGSGSGTSGEYVTEFGDVTLNSSGYPLTPEKVIFQNAFIETPFVQPMFNVEPKWTTWFPGYNLTADREGFHMRMGGTPSSVQSVSVRYMAVGRVR